MELRRPGAQERDQSIERVRSILGSDDGSIDEPVSEAEAQPEPRPRLVADRRSVLAFVITAVVAAVIASAVTWFSRPTSEPVSPPALSAATNTRTSGTEAPQSEASPSAAATIVVSVIGYVATPGLVTLPEGSRVADAIAACGGISPGADLTTVNLARVLSDGEQIAVGVPGGAQASATQGGTAPTGTGAKVNINTASAEDFDSLPGIGPVIATRIIDFRTKNGKFKSVEDLSNVSGIGPSIMGSIKDLVTV
ncbi:competence protein ComEA [Antricoccus suffuscus]|uniref:Competence protein ComEA n=1 Tax=Antricoccus suffuscus TaxID=1629062 RepID=A0A2T0Z5G9_9ACTN|nr:ComEA family DNA-binding protein [Antricoccus suffuscus]PRZ31404.1 competence protein ComEA [Antricoccus suffuscus]